MSINNINPGLLTMPQIAQSSTGQLYMIATHQHQLAYLFPRSYLDSPQMPRAPSVINQAMFQQSPQPQQQLLLHPHQQQQLQLQLPPPPPRPPRRVPVQPPKPQPAESKVKFPSQMKDQTNAKIKNVKEKSITHYIDGHMIIETFKPPADDQPRSVKRRKTYPEKLHHVKNGDNDISPSHNISANFHSQLQLDVSTATNNHQAPQPKLDRESIQVKNLSKSSMQTAPQLPTEPQPASQIKEQSKLPTNSVVQKSDNDNQQANSNELLSLRAKMQDWSVSEVVKFIEEHEDIRQYASKFFDDEVDGKALLLMIDRNLNFRFQFLTSMFKHGPAMKIEAILAKYKLKE